MDKKSNHEDPVIGYNPNVDPIPKSKNAVNTNLPRAKISPISKNFKHLTPEDVEHFLKKGWIKVPGAIKKEYIDKWVRDLWPRMDMDPNDKSTWTSEYYHTLRQREVPAEEIAPEAWHKIVELAGGEHMIDPDRERNNGDNFIINFGTAEKAAEPEREYLPQNKSGWHTDDDWYRQLLDSTGNAMTVIHCWVDIPARGGGTYLCEDGIKGVVEYLYNHPEGLDPPHRTHLCDHVKNCKEFTQIVAKAGDVFITHGLLPHAVSANQLHYPRIITNPHVCLANPHNLNRHDGQYSLLEQVILNGLGRESVPEWKPTRERCIWFPRNSGFKRVRGKGEADRMVAAAVARGEDPKSVNAIYLVQGTKEWDDFQRRNGFHLPVNEATGLLMEPHTIGTF